MRTSSKKYVDLDPSVDLNEPETLMMQLTNNAVQKNGTEYQKYEEGNIISLDELFTHLSIHNFNSSKSK